MIWNDWTITYIYFKHILELQLKLIILFKEPLLLEVSRPLEFLHKKTSTFFISTVTVLPAVFTSNVPHDIDLSSLFWHTRNQNCCFNSFQILMLMYLKEIYNLVKNIKYYSSLEIKLVKIDFICILVSFTHATCYYLEFRVLNELSDYLAFYPFKVVHKSSDCWPGTCHH